MEINENRGNEAMWLEPEPTELLLEVRALRTVFRDRTQTIEAVREASLTERNGEIVGIVGESGCGKSVMMKSILGILPGSAKVQQGEMIFEGKHLEQLTCKELRKLRGSQIAMIFQDPMTALNPLRSIGYHLEEVLTRNAKLDKHQAKHRAVELLGLVGIPSPERRVAQFPHEFSGGMRQRVMIAMALAGNPKLLIADEPTTALDVTIQAQILRLLKKLNQEMGMSIVIISHDLGVVASLCHRIQVMYAGRVVEEGTAIEIFHHPRHEYTKALLKSIPKLNSDQNRLTAIKGTAPSLSENRKGCTFAPRCERAKAVCFLRQPDFKKITETHSASCIFAHVGGEQTVFAE